MLTIRTCSDALLSAFDSKGRRIASLFADHVPREIAEHRRVLQGLNADMSLANSAMPGRRLQLAERREHICERQRRRVRGVCAQAAEFVARLAERRGTTRVVYDDRDRSYVESFPWLQLQCVVKEKLDGLGVAFIAATELGVASKACGPSSSAGATSEAPADPQRALGHRSAG